MANPTIIDDAGTAFAYSRAFVRKKLLLLGVDRALADSHARQFETILFASGVSELNEATIRRALEEVAEEAPPDRIAETLRRKALDPPAQPRAERREWAESFVPPSLARRTPLRSSFAAQALDPVIVAAEAAADRGSAVGRFAKAAFGLAQATAEQFARPLVDDVLELLTASGLANEHGARVRESVLGGLLPVGPKALSGELVEAFSALDRRERERAVSTEGLLGTLVFEIDDRENEDAVSSEARLDGRYVISASLDQPRIVSGSDHSGKLFYPATFVADKDDVTCVETFDGRARREPSYEKDDVAGTVIFQGFPFSAVPFDGLDEYRSNINDDLPTPFWERILAPWPDLHVFTLSTFESADGDLVRWLHDLLASNADKIDEKIDEARDDAEEFVSDLVGDLAGAAGGVLAPPMGAQLGKALGKLAGKALVNVVTAIRDGLLEFLSGSEFETWYCAMAVFPVGGRPYCQAVLRRPGTETSAFQAIGADVLEEAGSPDYEDPDRWKLPLDVLVRGRAFRGPTDDPTGPVAFQLWGEADRRNQPIIWSSPDGSEGIHALLPTHEVDGEARYVWSFRLAIQAEQVDDGASGDEEFF